MPGAPQTFRFRQQLDRLFDLRGHSAELAVLDDVFPTVEVADMADPEYHHLRGEEYGGTLAAVAGTAANYAKTAFGLPAGNQPRLAVIEQVLVTQQGTAVENVYWGLGPLGGTGMPTLTTTAKHHDARASANAGATDGSTPAMAFMAGQLADNVLPTVGVAGRLAVPQNVVLQLATPIIVVPGWALVVYTQPDAAAGVLTVTVVFRERVCEAQELL